MNNRTTATDKSTKLRLLQTLSAKVTLVFLTPLVILITLSVVLTHRSNNKPKFPNSPLTHINHQPNTAFGYTSHIYDIKLGQFPNPERP